MRIKKYYKMVRVDYEDEGLFEISNLTSSNGTITVDNYRIKGGATLQYSTDGANWTTAVFTSSKCEITLPANGNCYFKGTNFYMEGNYNSGTMFNCSVNYSVKGNLYSIVDQVNYASATYSYNEMFNRMFYEDTHLVDAGGLMFPVGVTSIVNGALRNAFKGCTSLVTPPNLSNITSIGIGGLYTAFKDCSSLVTAPDLSNVTSIGDQVLQSAFWNCSKLQTVYVPNINSWDTSKFSSWLYNAGSTAETPKQMIFQTQALLDACPSGESGYGGYTKVLA